MLRRCAVALIVMSWCAGAAAEEGGTTSLLHVYLRDPNCEKVTKVEAVIQDDREIISTAVKQPDRCHWKINTAPIRFRSNRTHFSLRLSGVRARTNCRIPGWNDVGVYAEAEFSFLSTVRELTITPSPQMNLNYVREVSPSDRKDVGCNETGILGKGSDAWTVAAVSLKDEKLRLLDFESKKDKCGLIVNAVPGVAQAETKDPGEIKYSVVEIGQALTDQRNKGLRCQAPNLSGYAVEISEKNIERKPLTGLTIGWK